MRVKAELHSQHRKLRCVASWWHPRESSSELLPSGSAQTVTSWGNGGMANKAPLLPRPTWNGEGALCPQVYRGKVDLGAAGAAQGFNGPRLFHPATVTMPHTSCPLPVLLPCFLSILFSTLTRPRLCLSDFSSFLVPWSLPLFHLLHCGGLTAVGSSAPPAARSLPSPVGQGDSWKGKSAKTRGLR